MKVDWRNIPRLMEENDWTEEISEWKGQKEAVLGGGQGNVKKFSKEVKNINDSYSSSYSGIEPSPTLNILISLLIRKQIRKRNQSASIMKYRRLSGLAHRRFYSLKLISSQSFRGGGKWINVSRRNLRDYRFAFLPRKNCSIFFRYNN